MVYIFNQGKYVQQEVGQPLLPKKEEYTNIPSSKEPSKSNEIPKNFQGTWADEKGCAQFKAGSEFDPGAVITSDHINRYEHYCALTKVTVSSATSFSGEFTCQQEGESSNENISLTLQPDGTLAGIASNPLPKCN